MKGMIILAMLVALGSGAAGCATAMRGDLKDSTTHVYPATRTDALMIGSGLKGEVMGLREDYTVLDRIVAGAFQSIIWTVDLPFSIVSDTLCLPYDVWTRGEGAPNKASEDIGAGAPNPQR